MDQESTEEELVSDMEEGRVDRIAQLEAEITSLKKKQSNEASLAAQLKQLAEFRGKSFSDVEKALIISKEGNDTVIDNDTLAREKAQLKIDQQKLAERERYLEEHWLSASRARELAKSGSNTSAGLRKTPKIRDSSKSLQRYEDSSERAIAAEVSGDTWFGRYTIGEVSRLGGGSSNELCLEKMIKDKTLVLDINVGRKSLIWPNCQSLGIFY